MSSSTSRTAEPLVPPGRLLFFGGKGGVGKTTCAAATAVRLARLRRRVLAISLDPAHSLGDVLQRPLGPSIRPVRVGGSVLAAVELSGERLVRRWMRRHRHALRDLALSGTYLDEQDVERFLDLSMPGLDDCLALLEIARLARSYEATVVDFAPTGQSLRTLGGPGLLLGVAEALDRLNERPRLVAQRFGARAARTFPDRFLQRLEAEAHDVIDIVRDRERAVVAWVCVPEPVTVAETRDGLASLARHGVPPVDLIVNRVTLEPDRPCDLCGARRRSEGAALRRLRRLEHVEARRILPRLPQEPTGIPRLDRLGRVLLDPTSVERRGTRVAAGVAAAFGLPQVTRKNARGPAADPGSSGAPRTAVELTRALEPLALAVVAGKGGVGKSTCSAAIALRLAGQGAKDRVLLLSTDPAHSLGDVLDLPIGDEPTPVPGRGGRLRARELDAGRALRRIRRRYGEALTGLVDRLASRADERSAGGTVVGELLNLAPPGMDEILGVVALMDALLPRRTRTGPTASASDKVVLDTPPTGHALRLLRTPAIARQWVHSMMRTLLKYREVSGLELAGGLVELSKDLGRLEALLADPNRTAALIVTRAAAVPVRETARLLSGLDDLAIAVAAVIVNGLTPPGCSFCDAVRTGERRAVARLRRMVRARRGAVPCAMIVAPATAPPPRGASGLTRWMARWSGGW